MSYVISKMAPENTACVYPHDIVTIERALKERVFFVDLGGRWQPAPTPLPGLTCQRLEQFRRRLKPHLPSTTQCTYEEFLSYYTGRKFVVYKKAVESLRSIGISARDSRIKAFVKAEKGKPGSAPRVIQPRDPRYNVEVGRFIKPIEERLCKAISKVFGGPTVMKGYNAHGVAKQMHSMWTQFSKPVAIGLDAKRFDQHVSVDMLRWEHGIYKDCIKSPVDRAILSELLSWQLINRGSAYCKDGKLRYKVKGKRMSGDMNTGLGNCLLMSAMVYSYCKSKCVNIRLANNGDDCVVFMETRDMDRFRNGLEEWFLELGFQIVAEAPVHDFERIEFCQSHPVHDGYQYTMVRNLRAFVKDSVSLVPLTSPFTVKSWLAAVGDAGMSLTGGIPIWQEYYSVYQRSSEALTSQKRRRGASRFVDQSAFETGMMMAARGMHRKYGDVSPYARYSFWLAFGITPDHQIALEKQYEALPLIRLMTNADEDLLAPPYHNGFTDAY
uniref:RNA-directed RNA polymerase n=1 Tax=Riboviria sp. TaxID=2585031 RepID=A0A514DBE2_9VIRU|nr:MAG: RNA-dependent RNA polymerase [Riboviria sp.]